MIELREGVLWKEGQKYEGNVPSEGRMRGDLVDVTAFGDVSPRVIQAGPQVVELNFDGDWLTFDEALRLGVIWPVNRRPAWGESGHDDVHTGTLTAMDDDDTDSTGLLAAADAEVRRDAKVRSLVEWARLQAWSSFCVSVAKHYDEKGWLSDKQVSALESTKRKTELTRAAKAGAATPPAKKRAASRTPRSNHAPPTTVDLSAPNPNWSATSGFYRKDGEIYKNIYPAATMRLEAPEEFGYAGRWLLTIEGVDRPDLKMGDRLSIDNVLGFGQMNGCCLMCAGGLVEGEDEVRGAHGSCEQALYEDFGYPHSSAVPE